MAFPSDDMRPIQYPIDRSQGLEYDTGVGETIDNDFNWQTTDNDEKVVITLELSLNEYVALASAIDVGRDIAYGQASLAIWWLWIRSVNPMAFCEQVDNCITTNTTTQIAINNTLLSNGIINPDQIQPISPQMDNRLSPAIRATDSAPPPPSCNKDALWAGILEMVTRINELGLDFLQDIVAYNDKAERIANIIDIVPIFGDIAADIITVFADIAPDLLNAYLAHSSQQVLEDTACALFELVCNECRYPTYDELFAEYANAGISGIEDIASYGVTALMDYFIGSNNLGNSVVWYTMQAGVLYTLYLGSTFVNRRGLKWLKIWASIGEESPSNSWTVLCNGCGDTWCYEFDFTVSDGGFIALDSAPWTPIFGLWSGLGWASVFANQGVSYANLINISKDFVATEITSMEITYDYTIGYHPLGNYASQIALLNAPAAPEIEYSVNPDIDGLDKIITWNGVYTATRIELYSQPSYWIDGNPAHAQGNVLIKKLKLTGTGSNPFGVDNCV